MKNSVALKRIRNYDKNSKISLVNKDGSLRKVIKNDIDYCLESMKGLKMYPKGYAGSGKHIRVTDRSFYVEHVLKALGHSFVKGNDAPRCGKSGDFIKITKAAINNLNNLI